MMALSIRQPWAWLILHAGKDIENRTWPTRFRGRVLIHASKGMTVSEFDDGLEAYWDSDYSRGQQAKPFPGFHQFPRGGIVGSVEIVDCVTKSESPWFCGPYGFVLRDPKPMSFVPARGALGFFFLPVKV